MVVRTWILFWCNVRKYGTPGTKLSYNSHITFIFLCRYCVTQERHEQGRICFLKSKAILTRFVLAEEHLKSSWAFKLDTDRNVFADNVWSQWARCDVACEVFFCRQRLHCNKYTLWHAVQAASVIYVKRSKQCSFQDFGKHFQSLCLVTFTWERPYLNLWILSSL